MFEKLETPSPSESEKNGLNNKPFQLYYLGLTYIFFLLCCISTIIYSLITYAKILVYTEENYIFYNLYSYLGIFALGITSLIFYKGYFASKESSGKSHNIIIATIYGISGVLCSIYGNYVISVPVSYGIVWIVCLIAFCLSTFLNISWVISTLIMAILGIGLSIGFYFLFLDENKTVFLICLIVSIAIYVFIGCFFCYVTKKVEEVEYVQFNEPFYSANIAFMFITSPITIAFILLFAYVIFMAWINDTSR